MRGAILRVAGDKPGAVKCGFFTADSSRSLIAAATINGRDKPRSLRREIRTVARCLTARGDQHRFPSNNSHPRRITYEPRQPFRAADCTGMVPVLLLTTTGRKSGTSNFAAGFSEIRLRLRSGCLEGQCPHPSCLVFEPAGCGSLRCSLKSSKDRERIYEPCGSF